MKPLAFQRLIFAGIVVAGGCNGGSAVAPAISTAHTVSSSPTFKSLYSFKGVHATDGAFPGGLTDQNGVLYGTTSQGGSPNNYGTVFSITTLGNEKVLYAFQGLPKDGSDPGPSSLIALNGVLYGTTVQGGTGACRNLAGTRVGCGTVFSITTSGQEKVIYSFQGGQDGAFPGGLIVVKGVLYGTTQQGGGSGCGGAGCGTVFSVTTSGQEKVRYSFKTFLDGNYPNALIRVNGTLYGTTNQGGDSSKCNSCGAFFSLTTSGQEKVLYSFLGYPNDGAGPAGRLIGVNGTLYGVTTSGGGGGLGYCDSPFGACGTVYSITTTGQELVLHSFGGAYNDGSFPMAGVIAVRGVLYGTTYEGGNSARNRACHDRYGHPVGCGTVFSITTSGQESVLYDFSGGMDGGYPAGSLAAGKRWLYGTTTVGGANNFGTVFELRP